MTKDSTVTSTENKKDTSHVIMFRLEFAFSPEISLNDCETFFVSVSYYLYRRYDCVSFLYFIQNAKAEKLRTVYTEEL